MKDPRFQVDESAFISPQMVFAFVQDMKAFAETGRKAKAQLIGVCDLLIEENRTRIFLPWSAIDGALDYSLNTTLHQIHAKLLMRLQRHGLDACFTIDPNLRRPYNSHGLTFTNVRGKGIQLVAIKSVGGVPLGESMRGYFRQLQSRLISSIERGSGEKAVEDLAQIDLFLETSSFPQQLGQYRIIRKLGAGSTGTVYLAQHQLSRHGQLLAIKVLHPHLKRNVAFFRRFIRGADILALLQHPNIARVLHVSDVVQGYIFYVTEYVDNGTIQCLALSDLTVQARLSLLSEIIDALAYLHQNGIVHLDLKPSNVLLTKDLSPKLVDFDTSHVEGMSTLTSELMESSLPYVSEERSLNPSERKPDNDVYSFGVLALEILNGRADLPKEEHVRRIAENDKLRPYCPILARCLQPRSSSAAFQRYEDAGALKQAWQRVSQDDPKQLYRTSIVIGSREQGLSLRNETIVDRVFDRMVIPQSNFRDATLIRCSFQNCVLSDAVFSGATIQDCNFEGSFLIMSRFHNAKVKNTKFRYTNLERTVWDGVDVAGIDFAGSNLWGAFLSNTHNFGLANFAFCNFCRAELSELQQSHLAGREDIDQGLLYSRDQKSI